MRPLPSPEAGFFCFLRCRNRNSLQTGIKFPVMKDRAAEYRCHPAYTAKGAKRRNPVVQPTRLRPSMRLRLAARLAAGVVVACAVSACNDRAAPSAKDVKASADVRIETPSGLGSGVNIGDGIIITAAHVVAGNENVVLRGDNGDVQGGEVLWVNTAYDIAAVRPLYKDHLSAVRLDCRVPRPGEDISATGNPLGVEFITAYGHVAGKERAMPKGWRTVVPVDLNAMPGMSGGAVYDREGDVVGIIVGGVKAPNTTAVALAVPASAVCGLLGRVSQ